MKGNVMERIDAPICLRHAREEMLLALDAPNAEDECQHRLLAGNHITKAMREMRREPDRKRDWARLSPTRSHAH